jgi:hypothetical protein
MNTLKLRIAKMIESGYYPGDNHTYKVLLESIYDNAYRTIHKVPADTFLLGIVQSFSNLNQEKVDKILNSVKEVVQEALETSGIELTFSDEDWHNLTIKANHERWGNPWLLFVGEDHLITKKGYMCEFFEL